jgi:hypothetical protein
MRDSTEMVSRRLLKLVLAAILIVTAGHASAQSVARFSLDSVVSVDTFGGENVSSQPQVIVDVSAGMRIGDRWQLYVRPWFRQPRPSTPTSPTPEPDREIYQAGIRYERPGRVATRVDAGYIVSPVGLGMLDARPSLNPTIAPHLSYLVPMPSFDTKAPRVAPVALTYPLGAQATLSTARWDARVAVTSTTPARTFVLGAYTNPNPPTTPSLVVGAGVTPVAGFRAGVSFATGRYASTNEVGSELVARAMTMAGVEAEYSFGYTRVSGELVRTAFDRPTGGTAAAYEWFIEGVQTLAPRWFVAARQETAVSPAAIAQRELKTVETSVGFRVAPEWTVRGSYYAREFYGAPQWDNQIGASLVWARRWW